MSYFSLNIKYLRNKKKLSQEAVAIEMGFTRGMIASYEKESAPSEPPLSIAITISEYFKVGIEDLIYIDLSKDEALNHANYSSNTNQEEKEATNTNTNSEKQNEMINPYKEQIAELRSDLKKANEDIIRLNRENASLEATLRIYEHKNTFGEAK